MGSLPWGGGTVLFSTALHVIRWMYLCCVCVICGREYLRTLAALAGGFAARLRTSRSFGGLLPSVTRPCSRWTCRSTLAGLRDLIFFVPRLLVPCALVSLGTTMVIVLCFVAAPLFVSIVLCSGLSRIITRWNSARCVGVYVASSSVTYFHDS